MASCSDYFLQILTLNGISRRLSDVFDDKYFVKAIREIVAIEHARFIEVRFMILLQCLTHSQSDSN